LYIWLIAQGKHSVWFRTPIGEAAGVVEFGPNGQLGGGIRRFLTKGIGR
jgi:hypothetical protein